MEALVFGGGEVESDSLFGKVDARALLVDLLQVEGDIYGGGSLVEVASVASRED